MTPRFVTAVERFALVLAISLIASSAQATEFKSRQPAGNGTPPEDIVSSGLSGVITKVKVTLYDVNIPDPAFISVDFGSVVGDDIFALIDLTENDGSWVPVTANHATITFDDFSTKRLDISHPLTSGTFQRMWFQELRIFPGGWAPYFYLWYSGRNPNRAWHLNFAVGGNGTIGGWSVDIETASPVGDPQTFTSASGLTISDSLENASPYPLTLDVAGLDGLVVYDVSATVTDFSYPDPMDIDMLVESPDKRAALIFSDDGGICENAVFPLRFFCPTRPPADHLTLTFSQSPGPPPPGSNWPWGPLVSGTYQPFDVDDDLSGGAPNDFFPAPAFSGGKYGSMTPLWGAPANGTWKLYVHDDDRAFLGQQGSIASWSVTIQPGLPEPLALDPASEIVTTNTPGQCTAPITFDLPFAKGSPSPSVTVDHPSGSLFPAGVTPVTITASNIFGSVTQTFNVTVNDIEAPALPQPANIVVGNDPNPLGTIVNFSLASSDNCSATVTANPPSGSYFPLGTTTVTAFATDPAGNQSNVVQFTVTVQDHTGPVISYQATPPITGGWATSEVSLTITATDTGGSGLEHVLCIGTPDPLDGVDSVATTITAEGETTIRCFAKDLAGNETELTLPTVRIDRLPPQIVVTRSVQPNANGWNNTDVVVHFAVSDAASGIAPGSDTDTDKVFTAERSGQSTFFVAFDKAGHCAVAFVGGGSSSCASVLRYPAINIDKTAPNVTLQRTPAANANGWNNTDVTVHVAATDAVSGIDGPTVSDDVFTVDGQYPGKTITFTDRAGNSTTITTPTVLLDKTPPQIVSIEQVPAPNEFGWNRSPVVIRAGVFEQGSTASATSFQQVIDTEGIFDVPFTVTDQAGNSATHVFHVRTDFTPPTITAERSGSPNANGWDQSVFITFKGQDAGSGFGTCCIGQQGVPFTQQSLTFNTEGRGVVATSPAFTDRAGNVGVPASLTLNIDHTPPVVNTSRSPLANPSGYNNTPVTVHFDASDAVSGLTGPATEDVVFSNDGFFTVQRTFTDLAGNTTSSFVNNIWIDKTPPSIQASFSPGPNANGWNNTNVTVRFDVLDNGGSGAVTPVVFVPLTQEGVNLGASQTFADRAGNSAPGAIAGINIDKTAPQVNVVLSPPANQYGWNNTDVLVQFSAADALSGVAGDTSAQQMVTGTGQIQVLRQFFDRAGNRADRYVNVMIDKTPPSLYCYANPAFLTPGGGLLPASIYVYLDDGDSGDSSGGPAYIHLLSVTSNRPQPGAIVDWATGTEDYDGFLLAGTDKTIYTFTYEGADRAGNTGTCSATVTVAYAPNHVTAIAPHSAVAGAGTNIDLIITGDGFVNGAVVRWNATPLSSTFVSENEIHATVPASALTTAGGVVVTVENPSPYAGVPGAGVFLVTNSPTTLTGMATGQASPDTPYVFLETGAPPEGGPDTLFVTGYGDQGTVAIATFSDNPGTAFAGGVNFFDVFVSPGATFQSLTITTCALGGATQLFWASPQGWRLVSNQTFYEGSDGNPSCIQVEVDATGTSPTIADLAGTYFASGADITPPALKLPAPISVTASGPDGATVTYAASATDDTDPAPTMACTPPSGSVFPIGTTTVTCTAADATGHSSTGTFTVTVTQPAPTDLDGRMHGDGFVADGSTKHHFEFEVAERGDRERGRFDYNVTAPKKGKTPERDDRFTATSIGAVTFTDDPASVPGPKKHPPEADSVLFSGKGKWNGKSGYTFEVRATDRGEPGTGRDSFAVTIKDASGAVVATVSGVLAGGNVQSNRVHPM